MLHSCSADHIVLTLHPPYVTERIHIRHTCLSRQGLMSWHDQLYSFFHTCVVIVIVTHYLTLSDAVMVTRDDRTIPYIEIPPTNYNNI